MRVGVMPGQWGWPLPSLQQAWALAEDEGFDLIGCFDHSTSAPRSLQAWDALGLLCAMAGSTTRAALALWVANASLRHPFQLAAQVAVAHGVSAGRVELGLGAGSKALARHDHEALGIAFGSVEQRLERLGDVCEVLPRLWRGESVTHERLGLREAALGPTDLGSPPLLIGGRSEQALRLAARHGASWNLEEGSPEDFARLAVRAREAAELEGRTEAFPGTVQLFSDDLEPQRLAEQVAAFREAGAHTLMLIMDEPDSARIATLASAVRGA